MKNDPFIKANGKALTKDYALASAYGELIERIQNCYLIPFKASDAKKFSLQDLENLDYFFDNESRKIQKYIDYAKEICTNFADKKSEDYFINKSVYTLPFYHVNKNDVKYLPISLIRYTAQSTGCCAGNTREEAIVEGLSEIFERYVHKLAIIKKITFPDIPEEYYMQFDNIASVVNHLKKLGYIINVKDASIDGKYPVVCLHLAKTIGNDLYSYIHFGASPSLPIAIERAFSETFQGLDFSDFNAVSIYFKKPGIKNNSILMARIDNALQRRFVEINESFYNEKPDYEFSYDNWSYSDNKNNKELIDILIKKLLDDNCNVFIRDVSFLNFPAYLIYIPELMSNFRDIIENSGFEKRINYTKCNDTFSANIQSKITPLEFLDFCEYQFHLHDFFVYKNLKIYYLSALINLKQYEKALKVCAILKRNNYNITIISYIEEAVLLLLKNKTKKEIFEILSSKYGKFINNRLFNLFISDNALENAINQVRMSVVRRVNNLPKSILEQREKIADLIMEKYSQNIPNQTNLNSLLIR